MAACRASPTIGASQPVPSGYSQRYAASGRTAFTQSAPSICAADRARSLVVNPEDVADRSAGPRAGRGDVDYLIITSSTYEPYFQDLADWKELAYDSCTQCGRCSLLCPMGIHVQSMIQVVRNGIAAAGMAAHLAGACASESLLPVIGVPIDSSCLQGLDALLSTVQMPPGIPVATMAVGKPGAKNAGLLAVQILALSDAELAARLVAHRKEMADQVERKAAALLRVE